MVVKEFRADQKPASTARSEVARVVTVVLNWNGRDDTLECLASLQRADEAGFVHQILVVDNGSADDSVACIRDQFPAVQILLNPANLGFSDGMNRGIEWAREKGFDFVILLNNDTTVEADALRLLVEGAADPSVGAVMPLIRYYDSDDVWHAGARIIRPFFRVQPTAPANESEPYDTEVFTACCVLISMQALDAAGSFDPRYYLYLEDTDLALRIGAAGYRIRVVPRAIIRHKVSRSSGGTESPRVLYYLVRNNLLLARDRRGSALRSLLPYLYVAALTLKICFNVVSRSRPDRREIVAGVLQAWGDFFGGRLGKKG